MAMGDAIRCIKTTAAWLPVVFVVGTFLWSYYALLVDLVGMALDTPLQRALVVVLYHPLAGLLLWSYWRAIFTKPRLPPRQFSLSPEECLALGHHPNHEASVEAVEQQILERHLPIITRTSRGNLRICARCCCLKPDRAHHCSLCNTCVLKMDHHCPWVNNCVGFHNYKFFCLFLFYAVSYNVFMAGVTLPAFLRAIKAGLAVHGGYWNLLAVFIVAVCFVFSTSILFVYHVYLICNNCTTLESMADLRFIRDTIRGFSLPSAIGNIQEVFGPPSWHWLLPVDPPPSPTLGIEFPYIEGTQIIWPQGAGMGGDLQALEAGQAMPSTGTDAASVSDDEGTDETARLITHQ